MLLGIAMLESRPLSTPTLQSPFEPSQPAWLSALKLVGVVVSSLLLVSLITRLAGAIWQGSALWVVLPALVLGYLSADLMSGTAHWFCDTFFEEDTPILGPILIQPFRDHHRHPQRITRFRFIEQDTSNFFLMMPWLLLAWWREAPGFGNTMSLFWSSFLAAIAIGSFGTNLFHKWAHARSVSPVVAWLQRRGLILSPARHHGHHSDYETSFCVTSGLLNPLLNAIDFFPRLERLARRLLNRPRPAERS
jgi:hypothetical protein